MTTRILCILSTLAYASAQLVDDYAVLGFGPVDSPELEAAYRNPNATKSVPFQVGDMNFTLQVNVAEVIPNGPTSPVQDPRIAASMYTLEWSGGAMINDTLRSAESISGNDELRFCVSIPAGLYSASVTNGYKESDDGDCSGALGKDCVNDLKGMGYSPGVQCGITTIPDSCKSKFPQDGIGSTSLLSSNDSVSLQTSPKQFAWHQSSVYQAGNETFYEAEVEKLHLIIFSGRSTYPVCVRVKNDHVKKDSPATSGAESWRASLSVVVVAFSAVLFSVMG